MDTGRTRLTSTRAYHRFPALSRAAVLYLSACSGGGGIGRSVESAPPAGVEAGLLESKPFFVPGETLTWDVSFSGIAGGRARLAVGAVGNEAGRRLRVLRRE